VIGFWLDIIKERFLYDATAYLREHVKEKYGIETLSSINPGSGNEENWPITQQKLLFPLIGDVTGDIGVRLTDSCLMVPTKSVSGIFYPSASEFCNCLVCERRNCPNRRADFKMEN
jgi:cobalamin-dependent methionine synthase I